MKILRIAWLLSLPLVAQTTPPAPADAPADNVVSGSIELGYRFIPNISGSLNAYRSVVDLGEGPRIIGADFTVRDPTHRFFDEVDVHASGWGGDPYSTLRVDARKNGLYRLTVDYRNIAYFNFLPSFANPLQGQGSLLDSNSFDTHLRDTNAQLDLFPNRKISPYVAFSSNSQDGRGITSFSSQINAYPVATLISSSTNNYRAGVNIDLGRGHLLLEEGGTTFKDDQGESNTQTNSGDLLTPFSAQQLNINDLGLGYFVRGHSYYTRANFAVIPTSWLTVSGDFNFEQPTTNTRFTSTVTGTLYDEALASFYTLGQDMLTADARMPHSSADINVELRPFRRLRVLNYLMTDRLHNAAEALLAETLLQGQNPLSLTQLPSTDHMVMNYSQEEVDVLYDLTSHLTLRGGYRYVWGDSDVRAVLTDLTLEPGYLKRNVGLAGVTFRLNQKLRVNGDVEAASSDQAYFQTSLRNYQKVRARASYDLLATLRLSADFSLLNNSDPDPQIRNSFQSRAESVSAYWTPKSKKLFTVLVDYTRSTVHSDILYLVPQILQSTFSYYRDNAHTGTALASFKWFSAGGSFVVSSGSRPTQYYQPLARMSIPIQRHLSWNAEWRWYGFSERYYGYENFNSNQFMTSLRFIR
jgi:hypothetical protein